eukprot:GHVS01101812.1.p1 GENE.GHVS01101812.1~~GHVS01101812.1.p1  ORF type:complete len:349 (+),score=128.11 GHVS01101812.1:120-1049(+)
MAPPPPPDRSSSDGNVIINNSHSYYNELLTCMLPAVDHNSNSSGGVWTHNNSIVQPPQHMHRTSNTAIMPTDCWHDNSHCVVPFAGGGTTTTTTHEASSACVGGNGIISGGAGSGGFLTVADLQEMYVHPNNNNNMNTNNSSCGGGVTTHKSSSLLCCCSTTTSCSCSATRPTPTPMGIIVDGCVPPGVPSRGSCSRYVSSAQRTYGGGVATTNTWTASCLLSAGVDGSPNCRTMDGSTTTRWFEEEGGGVCDCELEGLFGKVDVGIWDSELQQPPGDIIGLSILGEPVYGEQGGLGSLWACQEVQCFV